MIKFKIEIESEWKPDKNQITIPGVDEKKPQREIETVAADSTLPAAINHVKKVLVHMYEKGTKLFVYATIEGKKMEFFRAEAEGIKATPKQSVHEALRENLEKHIPEIEKEMNKNEKKTKVHSTVRLVK